MYRVVEISQEAPTMSGMRVKDVKMSTSKEIYKIDFMSIESTLNISKVSTFKVSNVFGE